jgi:hypothetical protein
VYRSVLWNRTHLLTDAYTHRVIELNVMRQRIRRKEDSMTRHKQQRDRRIRIRTVRRDPPDLHKLSRALIALALEQAEAETEAEHEAAASERSEDAA